MLHILNCQFILNINFDDRYSIKFRDRKAYQIIFRQSLSIFARMFETLLNSVYFYIKSNIEVKN